MLQGKLGFILFAAQSIPSDTSYMLFSLGYEDTVPLQLDQKAAGKEQVWVRGWNKGMCQERKQVELREDSKDSRIALEDLKPRPTKKNKKRGRLEIPLEAMKSISDLVEN